MLADLFANATGLELIQLFVALFGMVFGFLALRLAAGDEAWQYENGGTRRDRRYARSGVRQERERMTGLLLIVIFCVVMAEAPPVVPGLRPSYLTYLRTFVLSALVIIMTVASVRNYVDRRWLKSDIAIEMYMRRRKGDSALALPDTGNHGAGSSVVNVK